MRKLTVLLMTLFLCAAVLPAAGEEAIPFGLEETVTLEGLCEMSGLYAEVLDDAAIAEGWYYFYTDTAESPANTIMWEPSAGNYTTAEVLFTVKNISGEPRTFGDRIAARMFLRGNGKEECFEGTVFQQNPGQTDTNGIMIMWSTCPVEIAPDESANVSFRFDIPKEAYETLCAAASGTETGIRESCEFFFENGPSVVIDLGNVLILASQYEF